MKPIWLLAMMWTVPPVAEAVGTLQVQRLGHDTLAGKRGVAMDQDRQRPASVEARRARLADPVSSPREPCPRQLD